MTLGKETDDKLIPHEIVFGCVTEETGLFKNQVVDGILGLANGRTSIDFPSINKQLYHENATDSSMFMLCIGKDEGTLIFGGYDPKLRFSENDQLVWIPTISSRYYSIELDKFYVGNVHVPHIPRVGTIDSGSSWVITSHSVIQYLYHAFAQYCEKEEFRCIGKQVKHKHKGLCYTYDTTMNMSLRDWMRSYPTLTFQIDVPSPENSTDQSESKSIQLHWYPSEYFTRLQDTHDFCIQMISIANQHETILGASFLSQYMIAFQPDENQVGFMRANCQDDPNRISTPIVDETPEMMVEECHMCDLKQEEVNIILFLAVGLLVVMLLSIMLLGKYKIKILSII